MNQKQLNTIATNVMHGAPHARLTAIREAKPQFQRAFQQLKERAEQQRREFKAWLEAWTSQRVEEALPRPLARPQDVRDARVAYVMATLMSLLHLLLDCVMAFTMGSNPLVFVMVSLVLIFGLKAAFLYLWRDEARPQRTRMRLTRYVLVPSLLLTLGSVGILLLGRTLTGALALLLLGVVNLALCGMAIGVLGLATGLFALGYLFYASLYAERHYNQTEKLARETWRVWELVSQAEQELQPKAAAATVSAPVTSYSRSVMTPAMQSEEQAQIVRFTSLDDAKVKMAQPLSRETNGWSHNGLHCHWLPTLLVVCLALLLSGCDLSALNPPANTSGHQAASPAKQAAHPGATRIRVYLDWSLSTADQPMKEAVQNLVTALPTLIAEQQAEHFAAYQFGRDGWAAQEIVALATPKATPAAATDATVVYGQMRAAQEQAAQEAWQKLVQEKLQGVTAEKLLPPANFAEPPCTDVQGVLQRIAESDSDAQEVVFLITDFHESCRAKLTPIPRANAATKLVVMLLPEQETAAPGAVAHEQFSRRRAEVEQTFPGAVVIPHFADLTKVIHTTEKKAAQ